MSQAPPPVADEIGTVVDIVDTLEELVGGARRLPFTPSVVVNEEEILELVDRIRVALPDDLMSARHTLDERDQMIERAEREIADATERADREIAEATARADEEAARVLREAEARAAALVGEHAIVRTATDRARALIADAEQHAAAQRSAADDYTREVMHRLEEQLERWLGTVREGLQTLPQPPTAEKGRRRKR
jgi:cell division septum initiation protein DivIVA